MRHSAREVMVCSLSGIAAIHDAFELYGRPKMYSWDPRDAQSMMFAYPSGPNRDVRLLALLVFVSQC